MGEFDWNKRVQSGILSSFFYGYIVMQVPGGWLAGRFGGKRVLGIAMTIVATATVLLPVLARQDYRFVYALRVVMGLASVSMYIYFSCLFVEPSQVACFSEDLQLETLHTGTKPRTSHHRSPGGDRRGKRKR